MEKYCLVIAFVFVAVSGCDSSKHFDTKAAAHHVYPGENIQQALEKAAKDPVNKIVKVHAGIYHPTMKGEALIWFNARHDGITLEADGEVTLTAANPEIADPKSPSYPAIVNHVVYFGDQISRRTIFRGFKITGANHFVPSVKKEGPFFYNDGGGIKIFRESSPTIQDIEVYGNYASPCGGGVSVEQLGFNKVPVLFKNSIFRDNRAQITGSAVDLLSGSSAIIENCLFVGNVSNTGIDYISLSAGQNAYNEKHGSGALTVFPGSRAQVISSTFTGNWAGVDDKGSGSTYINTIFWNNTKSGGISPGRRYELDLLDGSGVKGCYIHGETNDLRGTISRTLNRFDPPDPQFTSNFVPQSPEYVGVGYRPSK